MLDEAPLAVDVVGAELPAEVEVHHEAGAELQGEEPLAVEEEGLQPAVAQGADFAVLLVDGGSEGFLIFSIGVLEALNGGY